MSRFSVFTATWSQNVTLYLYLRLVKWAHTLGTPRAHTGSGYVLHRDDAQRLQNVIQRSFLVPSEAVKRGKGQGANALFGGRAVVICGLTLTTKWNRVGGRRNDYPGKTRLTVLDLLVTCKGKHHEKSSFSSEPLIKALLREPVHSILGPPCLLTAN